MRLRRLVVHGFKTFAGRAEVAFDGGITAIVGPNGSGKSNLVDAVRWVLGETNARELRGARMEEVIFSGGRGKTAMGVAQVELTLDNEEGRLGDDVEVALARRVTKGGESEYRINGSRVRLRDLERLLSATGLTQHGYAVVAQNDVDGIIQATPTQRRSLVEEAAGVRGLRAARDDALQRVGQVEARLLRLADQLADAEPRLTELGAQAEVALEQRALTERLTELRGSLARETWRVARGEKRRAGQRLGVARARAEAAGEAMAAFTDRLTDERRILEALRATRVEAVQRLEAARLSAERAAGEERRFADREAAGAARWAVARGELATAAQEGVVAETEVNELTGIAAASQERLGGLRQELEALRGAYGQANAAVRACDEQIRQQVGQAREADQAHARAVAQQRDAEGRVGLLGEAVARLVGEIETARAGLEGLRVESAGAARVAEAMAAQHFEAEQAVAAARAIVSEARSAVAAAETHLGQAQRRHREAAARAAGLRGQMEGLLGGSGGVAKAIQAGNCQGRRLVESFRVADPADQAAVEAALEAHLVAWVVDDLTAAQGLLDAEGVREELFQVGVEDAGAAAAPDGVRPALDAVLCGDEMRGILAECLDNVWLAPGHAAARAAVDTDGGRAILPDGTVVTRAGVRGGGRSGSTLALAAAERDARRQAIEAETLESVAQEQSEAALRVRSEAEKCVEERAGKAAAARAAAAESAAAAASGGAALAAGEQRLAALQIEVVTREDAVTTARAAAAAAEAEERSCQAAAEVARAHVASKESGAEQARAEAAQARDALQAREVEVARAEPEARDLARRLSAARSARDAAGHRTEIGEARLCGAEEDVCVAAVRRRQAAAHAQRALQVVEEAGTAAATAAGPLAAAEAAVQALEEDRSAVAVAAARADDEVAGATTEVQAAEARVAELAEVVRDDDDDEGPEPDADAAERSEREIRKLERRLGALGAVNALAPEQHGALAVRVRRLRLDHDDLAAACGDVHALADVLAGEIEGRFHEVFGAVDEHFRTLYAELFPGGRATLRLQAVEPPSAAEGHGGEDEAVASRQPAAPQGIEILAQPAGKRLQALSLLSGGERALTALAVILALQQVAPSPFYVFDEVDAPLDDANIGRFTTLLRRLAETQQFLVVTHNHATMAAADTLYGVTMDRDGASRLLSVRLKGRDGAAQSIDEREPAGVAS